MMTIIIPVLAVDRVLESVSALAMARAVSVDRMAAARWGALGVRSMGVRCTVCRCIRTLSMSRAFIRCRSMVAGTVVAMVVATVVVVHGIVIAAE